MGPPQRRMARRAARRPGFLNLALVPGRFAIRTVGYGERLGGYIDDIGGPKNVNRILRQGERLGVKLALDDEWILSAGFNQTNDQFRRFAICDREPHPD